MAHGACNVCLYHYVFHVELSNGQLDVLSTVCCCLLQFSCHAFWTLNFASVGRASVQVTNKPVVSGL